MDISFRKAVPEDIELLKYWDSKAHLVYAHGIEAWEWESDLQSDPEWREQLIAELNGRPLGFLQIIDPAKEPSKYWGEIGKGFRAIDIWIGEESDLGGGYGTEMMKEAIDKCFSDPQVHSVLVDPMASNTRAHRFYEKLGFEFERDDVLDGDACKIYCLTRENYEG